MANIDVVPPTNEVSNVHTVSLKGQVPGGAGIEILRAEMRLDIGSPLAVIRYAERGFEPRYGLRLDIDKNVFIDHLANDAQEYVLHLAAPKIAAMLGVELRAMRYMDFIKEQSTETTVSSTAGHATHDLADNVAHRVGAEGSVPGIQTGGHAVDGSNARDTRGITEKIVDTVTGKHVDDKTGRLI